ncbi:hypothetical protein GBC01_07735 [Bifidobacterium longum]|nr:hypothetical protein GBB95_06325 [Bifidobacterium longum]KAB7210707.1 hypothetical protein GBC22_07915 [Bifidobacterium longum]KAB7216634.1 hypothetical protein GBC01_07735 [Bifidobacterium longum]
MRAGIAGWCGSSSECPFIGNAHHDIFGRCPHYATANQFRATIFRLHIRAQPQVASAESRHSAGSAAF